jgi:hypothetical protein
VKSNPKGQKQQIAGCDIKRTVESGAVEATTPGGKRRTFTASQPLSVREKFLGE